MNEVNSTGKAASFLPNVKSENEVMPETVIDPPSLGPPGNLELIVGNDQLLSYLPTTIAASSVASKALLKSCGKYWKFIDVFVNVSALFL